MGSTKLRKKAEKEMSLILSKVSYTCQDIPGRNSMWSHVYVTWKSCIMGKAMFHCNLGTIYLKPSSQDYSPVVASPMCTMGGL